MQHLPRKLTRQDFADALSEVDTYVDVTVDDLMDLTRRADRHARLRHTERLGVARLMQQPVVTVRPDTELAAAARLLMEHRISGLPVVDDDGRLAGIITEADFLRAVGIPSHHPTHSLWQTLETLFAHHDAVVEPEGRVADLMVANVVTVAPADTLHEVVETMKKHRIKRVVVADAECRVVGMITRSDLVRVFFDRLAGSGPARA